MGRINADESESPREGIGDIGEAEADEEAERDERSGDREEEKLVVEDPAENGTIEPVDDAGDDVPLHRHEPLPADTVDEERHDGANGDRRGPAAAVRQSQPRHE